MIIVILGVCLFFGLCFLGGCMLLMDGIVNAARILSDRLATIKVVSNITTTTRHAQEE